MAFRDRDRNPIPHIDAHADWRRWRWRWPRRGRRPWWRDAAAQVLRQLETTDPSVKKDKSEDRYPPFSDPGSPIRPSLDKDLTDLVAAIEEVAKDSEESKAQVSPEFEEVVATTDYVIVD